MKLNLIKLFTPAILLFAFTASSNAQAVKPKFKKIIFIGYYKGAIMEHGPHIIDYSIQFNNDSIYYKANNFSEKTHNYGKSDTTYKIPDTLMRELNKIFSAKKKLKSHMITTKLPNGDTTYSGHIYLISATATDDKTESFIAVQPYLDKQLSMLIDKITSLPRGKIWVKRKIYHDSDLENMVLECQKTSNYHIPMPPPPTVMELKSAN